MTRTKLIMDSLLPILFCWLIAIILGHLNNPTLPDSFDGWLNFVTYVIAITFFLEKSSLLLRRMPYFDGLTVSLAGSSFALAILFGFAFAFMLWPEMRHNSDAVFIPSVGARIMLCIFAVFCIWFLSNTKVIYRKEIIDESHRSDSREI